MTDGKKTWRATVLWPLVCGVAYALAFEPGMGFGKVGPVGRVGPLLVLLSVSGFLQCLRNLSGQQARQAGFLFGLVSFGVGTLWLWHIFGVVSLVLWAYLAMFPAVFAGAWACVWLRCSTVRGWPLIGPLVAGCLWTTVEFLRSECVWLDFPWMTIGHGLGPGPLLPVVGVYGVGFVVVALLSTDFTQRSTGSPLADQLVVPALAVALILLTKQSSYPPPLVTSPGTPSVAVAALQAEGVLFDHYEALTKGLAEHADVIVWPEYALTYDVMKSKHDGASLLALATENKATLVVGTETRGEGAEYWNTALTLDASGERGRHFKQHTVHFFADGTPGKTSLPVQTSHGLMGTPICFDNDYQNVVREMTAAGAEFFAVPSMDPEKWGLKQHLQHAELVRLRAAENGRWMVVASSSGMTQLVDPNGYVRSRLEPMTRGVLTGQLVALKEQTFFTRHGWRFPWACMAGALLAVVVAWRRVSPPPAALPEHSH